MSDNANTVSNHVLDEMKTYYQEWANDGRAFTIVKNFYHPVLLAERFNKAGFDTTVRETPTYFLYGYGIRR